MTRLFPGTSRLYFGPTILVFVIVMALVTSVIPSTASVVKAQDETTVPNSTAATFPANAGTLGAIPDYPAGLPACHTDASLIPKDITFTVTGLSGAPANVEVSITGTHTWVGDMTAALIAPNATSFVLFGRTGATTAGGVGDNSDFAGPYNFKDSAAGANWWSAATTAGAAVPVAAGDYRSTPKGGAGVVNPPPVTTITTAFSGVANPNGTWTLRVTDGCDADTGSITAATLTITTGVQAKHIVDFDGDGKTDYTVVRNTGGGPTGAVTWFTAINGTSTITGPTWGIASDFFVPEDYDGDDKTDLAVWRPAAFGTFYILRSSDSTVQIVSFGQTGDDPTVVGDYDGDGKADPAVYRAGASAGQPSTWFYLGSLNNPSNNITFLPWGVNGDFPAPGDYDGDGRNDVAVQRNDGGGQGRFWINRTTGGLITVGFGTPTDVIVPGDYNGDGKTDLAVARGAAGQINWFFDYDLNGVQDNQLIFGLSATDLPTQGDYDGDGRVDIAVWRVGQFWVLPSGGGSVFVASWGANGDYPVANYNTH